MKPGIQTMMKRAGEEGCYALALCEMAVPGIRAGAALDAIIEGCDKGLILYDAKNPGHPDAFLVLDAARFVELLRGDGPWERLRMPADYQPRPGELACERWIAGKGQHFVARVQGERWDPIGASQTVARGKIESLRVFRRKV